MKVYVKKEDNINPISIGITITIVFLSISVGIFVAAIMSGKSFYDVLLSYGVALIFATIFLGFGMYFVYILIKRPKAYKVKLINKKLEIYNGKQITYMEFITLKESKQKDSISSKYMCYTIGENNLIVDNEYALRVKEFNWQPKFVEEINDSYENTKNKAINKYPKINISPVFFALEFFWGGILFFCVLGRTMYPQYKFIYTVAAIFTGVALFMTIKISKSTKNDNNDDKNE